MIYECAIDPAFLMRLGDSADPDAKCVRSALLRAFQPDSPHIRAGYPPDLNKIIAAKISEALAHATGKERKYLEKRKEVIKMLARRLTDYRPAKRSNTAQWDGSFDAECARLPFDIMIPDGELHGCRFRQIDLASENGNPFDEFKRSVRVRRDPESVFAAVAPALKNASSFTFVDPYYSPAEPKYRIIFKKYFGVIGRSASVRASDGAQTVAIICGIHKNSETFSEFQAACERTLPALAPANLTLKIYLISDLPGKQPLHNRYILTDIGALQFGHGLDCPLLPKEAGDEYATEMLMEGEAYDDITLLDSAARKEHLSVYNPITGASVFKWREPIIIKGTNI